jgi:cytidylate kinase
MSHGVVDRCSGNGVTSRTCRGRSAERQIRAADKTRAHYLKRFYNIDREGLTHYDLVVNTEALSPDEAASIVVRAAG